MSSSPRLDLRVVARFLDSLVDRDGQTRPLSRSALQRAARVNYDIFRAYVEALQAKGLVHPDGSGELRLTAAGLAFRVRLRGLLSELLGGGA